jgi:hypothetical protein
MGSANNVLPFFFILIKDDFRIQGSLPLCHTISYWFTCATCFIWFSQKYLCVMAVARFQTENWDKIICLLHEVNSYFNIPSFIVFLSLLLSYTEADLRQMEQGCLPPNLSSIRMIVLPGQYALQVNSFLFELLIFFLCVFKCL